MSRTPTSPLGASDSGTSQSRSYHHGDLRRALLDAALQLNEEAGLDGLTLREVARRAGVSHAAPYRHFSDKADLIGALTRDGWQTLTRQLQATTDTAAPDTVAALGVTYVQFAVQYPAIFRLMVRPELSGGAQDTARDAFGVLVAGIAQEQRAGRVRADDPQALALAAWSAVHGLSIILLDGLLPHTPEQVPLLARSVTDAVMRGLSTPLPQDRV